MEFREYSPYAKKNILKAKQIEAHSQTPRFNVQKWYVNAVRISNFSSHQDDAWQCISTIFEMKWNLKHESFVMVKFCLVKIWMFQFMDYQESTFDIIYFKNLNVP